MKNSKWQFINKSVQGASHIRKNTPCQDYSLCVSGEGGGLPMLLAVSDGHGGSRYVRSAQGAVYACEAAIEAAGNYADCVFSQADDNIIKQLAETRLKVDIIKKWQSDVLRHAENNPFTDEELAALGITKAECEDALSSTELSSKSSILAAYGATLLLAIVLENAIICEQIGDGDMLFYHKSGSRNIYSPIERDDSLLGNETTSLCSIKAPFYMRHSVTYLYDKANIPDLIMLSTDGYSNSFSSKDDYLKTLKDYYEFLRQDRNNGGEEYVRQNIEAWLAETSAEGSGDDITIVLAWRSAR